MLQAVIYLFQYLTEYGNIIEINKYFTLLPEEPSNNGTALNVLEVDGFKVRRD